MEESKEVLKCRPATSKNKELEMARDGGERREREREREREYMSGSVVSVCDTNPDYRLTSNFGWSHQSVLKL
jgi:hypothetical protein